MALNQGVFTISLDFELYWGVRDKRTIAGYRRNLEGVWNAVPAILDVFKKQEIHATWATVGFLFLKDLEELRAKMPALLPDYTDRSLSPYLYASQQTALEKQYHFAPELIQEIRGVEGQEIGTHTHSHYYCLEEGQSVEAFRADLSQAIEVARQHGISFKSLVFPRNQMNAQYLSTMSGLGLRCYRGNPSSWMHSVTEEARFSLLKRMLRLLDTYLNLSGNHTHQLSDCFQEEPYNFPASRFLRPYSRRFRALEGLRLRRIKNGMNEAAQKRRMFHLWWHPHNFGADTAQNIQFLNEICEHFAHLKKEHGMASMNMGELCSLAGAPNGRP